jgi:hypothetical protein
MDMLSRFFVPGIGFILTVVFGFWLSKLGKPYNSILFNFHKLIALGTVIVTAMQVHKILNLMDAQFLVVVLFIVAMICVVILFASGAFLSIGNMNYNVMKIVHATVAVLLVIAMALTMCPIYGRTL